MGVVETLLTRKDFPEGICWHKSSFKENSEIVAMGESSNTIYYLSKGRARVLGNVEVNEGRNMRPGVYDLSEGEVFGELALFDTEPRSASVVALEPCEVIQIDGDQLNRFMEGNKVIGYDIMRQLMLLMVGRLRKANQKVFSLLAWGLKAHHIEDHLN